MQYILFTFIIIIAVIAIVIFKSVHLPGLVKKAEEYMDNGEYGKASEIVRKVLDKKRDYVPARFLKAKLLKQQTQYLMAISEFNGILSIPDYKKFVTDLDIHYNLAELYNSTNNWSKEIDEYKIILTFNPDDLNGNHRIGHAFYMRKNYKKAREYLLKAVTLDPGLSDCYRPLGISCYKTSDYEHAEEYLIKSMELPGDRSEIYFYLGSIFKMKKDYDNAAAMLEKARSNREYFTKSLYLLGNIFYEKGIFKTAIEYLEEGLNHLKEKSDEEYEYRYLLAECFELENRIKEAVYHWEKINAGNPNFRSTGLKLKSYKDIMRNTNLMTFFTSPLDDLQHIIVEVISGMNYNIVSKKKINPNEYQYKAYNIKRINDPPVLIQFSRTTKEITEGQIVEFQKEIAREKCKSGMYITTSRFSLKAKSSSANRMIELYDSDFVIRSLEKIKSRKGVINGI